MTKEAQQSDDASVTGRGPSALLASFRALPPAGSTADRVHQALKLAIETSELEPGARLAEESLAEAFEVSRTPIREALVRLESEDLAKRDKSGSLFVSQMTEAQIIELYVVREALDGATARLAARHADSLAIQKLRRINGRMAAASAAGRFQEMAELNIQFHGVLATASRNLMLEAFVEQIHRFVRRFQTTTFQHGERSDIAVAEHQRIIEALEQRDPDLAEARAREHMRNALEVRIIMESLSD